MGNTSRILAIVITMMGLWSLAVKADENVDYSDFFSNPTPPPGPVNTDGSGNIDLGGGSGLANSIASPVLKSTDPTTVNYSDQQAADNSRKNALQTAGSSSGTGQAVHAAVGGTMIGIGTPMTMSIDPVVKAAGYDLVAKGITELAQSGADSGTKDKNNDRRDALTQKANEEGKNASGNDIQKAVTSNADLNKFLNEKGVDPQDFANKVASGELQDPASIAKALGDNTEFSADDLAKAADISNSQMNDIFSQGNTPDGTREKIGYDETNAVTLADGTIRGGSGSKPDGSAEKKAFEQGKLGVYVSAEGFAPNHTQPGSDGNKNARPGFDAKGLLAEIFGADGQIKPDAAQKAMELLGIRKLKNGRNIFQEAGYHYRGWGKWRRNRKVATVVSRR